MKPKATKQKFKTTQATMPQITKVARPQSQTQTQQQPRTATVQPSRRAAQVTQPINQ